MNRPYIICHMMTSIDGKVTGDFLLMPECSAASEIYYRINRERKADGFICGRVTMEGSFTGGCSPDLSGYLPVQERTDFVADAEGGFYAVAFDTHGKLGWSSGVIEDPDGDPGYDGARIIEVLSEDVDGRYLGYLRKKGISYIFAGEKSIDVSVGLIKLKTLFGCNTLLLEGGSILDGAFLRAGAVDELSLVVAPVVAGADAKPLFDGVFGVGYELLSERREDGCIILSYKTKRTDN